MIPKCIHFWKGQIKYFYFGLESHSFSLTHLLQHYCGYWNHAFLLCEHLGCIMQIFPHCDIDMWGRVWMCRFREAWQSLNFDKEYLFGFETLVFATSGILSLHNQLVTLQSRILQSDTEYRYRLWSGHFLRIGYRSDETDPNPMLCIYYSVLLLLSPTKIVPTLKHHKAP